MDSNTLNPTLPLQESLESHISQNIAELIYLIDDQSLSESKKIHQIRRQCKHHRALCEMIAPITHTHKTAKLHHDFYKQIAKTISQDRDTKVMQDTIKRLVKRYNIAPETYTPISNFLNTRSTTSDTHTQNNKLKIIQTLLCQSRAKLTHLPLEKNNYKALKIPIKQTYRKAQTLLQKSKKSKNKEHYHEFRKYAKYHMLQLSILKPSHSLEKRIKKLDKLTEKIGKIHDLELLETIIQKKPIPNAKRLLPYIKSERKRLHNGAKKLQKKIFCQNPKRIANDAITH